MPQNGGISIPAGSQLQFSISTTPIANGEKGTGTGDASEVPAAAKETETEENAVAPGNGAAENQSPSSSMTTSRMGNEGPNYPPPPPNQTFKLADPKAEEGEENGGEDDEKKKCEYFSKFLKIKFPFSGKWRSRGGILRGGQHRRSGRRGRE